MAGRAGPVTPAEIPDAWIGVVAGGHLAAHGLLFALWAVVQEGDTGGRLQAKDGAPLSIEEIARRTHHPARKTSRLMADLIFTGHIARKQGADLYVLPHVVAATKRRANTAEGATLYCSAAALRVVKARRTLQ